MNRHLIVVEQTETGYSAYLPGCISTGRTREDVEKNIQEAIGFHLEGLRQEGESVVLEK